MALLMGNCIYQRLRDPFLVHLNLQHRCHMAKKGTGENCKSDIFLHALKGLWTPPHSTHKSEATVVEAIWQGVELFKSLFHLNCMLPLTRSEKSQF